MQATGRANLPKLLIFLLFTFTLQASVKADQVLLLEDFDPNTTNLGIFNSFKYHTVIIAITQKNKLPFDCHANRYIFYDYKLEDYFEIAGGNLKINGNYTKIITSKLLTKVSIGHDDTKDLQNSLQQIASTLNVSLQTLASGKSVSTDKTVSCWQQIELVDRSTRERQSFPFLLANACQFAWCSEMYWIDDTNVNLWIQTEPKEFRLILLNTISGDYRFKSSTPKFTTQEFMQLNAPRDNLVTKTNLSNGSFTLNSKLGNRISLMWKLRPNKQIRIELIRAKSNKKAAESVVKNVQNLISQKQHAEALRLINFGFWLKPDHFQLRYEKLRIYASLALTENFFSSLKDGFTETEKFEVCKKLHVDPVLKQFWVRKDFEAGFKQLCL